MDASGWDERYAATDLVWSATPNMFVVEEITRLQTAKPDGARGRAVDLAGGEGRNAVWLAEQGWDVELVEFSAVAREKARQVATKRGVTLTTTLADVTAEIAVEPADLVLVCYLQLEKPLLERALRRAAQLVKPGGMLLVVAHERDNLENGYGGPQNPDHLPTVKDVVDAVSGELTIERAEQVTRRVDTEEGPRDAIDLVVRAVRSQ